MSHPSSDFATPPKVHADVEQFWVQELSTWWYQDICPRLGRLVPQAKTPMHVQARQAAMGRAPDDRQRQALEGALQRARRQRWDAWSPVASDEARMRFWRNVAFELNEIQDQIFTARFGPVSIIVRPVTEALEQWKRVPMHVLNPTKTPLDLRRLGPEVVVRWERWQQAHPSPETVEAIQLRQHVESAPSVPDAPVSKTSPTP